jgi:hypothetical protein
MVSYQDVLFRSGDLFLPKGVRRVLEYYYIGNDKTVFYITNWSIIHYLTGILFAYLLRNYKSSEIYIMSFLLHCIWEAWQIFGENTKIGTLRGKVDTFTDTVLYMLGVFTYITYFRKQKF